MELARTIAEQPGLASYDFETGDVEEVVDIERAEPVLDGLSRFQVQRLPERQEGFPEHVVERDDDARAWRIGLPRL